MSDKERKYSTDQWWFKELEGFWGNSAHPVTDDTRRAALVAVKFIRAALDAPGAAHLPGVQDFVAQLRPDVGDNASCASSVADKPSAQELSDEAMRAICAYFKVTPGQVLDALAAKAQGGSHG